MTQDCQRPVITCIQAVAHAAVVFFCLGSGAAAEEVTITTSEDGVTLSGRVVGYDGTLLQLETSYGLITLNYAGTSCEGSACPDPDNYVPQVRLSGEARMARVTLPALIDAYGRSVSQSTVIRRAEDDLMAIDLVSDIEEITATFNLRLSSTDEGFADLIALETDIVMAMREVRPEEAERARLVGLGSETVGACVSRGCDELARDRGSRSSGVASSWSCGGGGMAVFCRSYCGARWRCACKHCHTTRDNR